MGCILWVGTVIYTLPQSLQWYMQNNVTLDSVITALDCITAYWTWYESKEVKTQSMNLHKRKDSFLHSLEKRYREISRVYSTRQSHVTSWGGDIFFRVAGPLWRESTGHQWISIAKGQWYTDLLFHLLFARMGCWSNSRVADDLKRYDDAVTSL